MASRHNLYKLTCSKQSDYKVNLIKVKYIDWIKKLMAKKGNSKSTPPPPPNPNYPSSTGQPSGKGRGNKTKK